MSSDNITRALRASDIQTHIPGNISNTNYGVFHIDSYHVFHDSVYIYWTWSLYINSRERHATVHDFNISNRYAALGWGTPIMGPFPIVTVIPQRRHRRVPPSGTNHPLGQETTPAELPEGSPLLQGIWILGPRR